MAELRSLAAEYGRIEQILNFISIVGHVLGQVLRFEPVVEVYPNTKRSE